MVLQKPLVAANRFPQHDILSDFEQDDAIKSGFDGARTSILSSIEDLVSLQNTLLSENPKVTCPSITFSSDIDSLWESIQEQNNQFASYRDPALEDWNRRTKLGGANIGSKNFQSINSSLETQMKNLMKDKDILIEKTRQITFEQPIIGKRKAETQDPEIYDDREFYQILLRDLIEDVGASLGSKENIRSAISKNLKKDKKPWRREKGKDIKYVPHAKLVGFMAPDERPIPESSEKLFESLFGGIPQEFQEKIKSLDEN